ncbi:MAG: potassium channel family protein [Ornithinimicrobium sp.]
MDWIRRHTAIRLIAAVGGVLVVYYFAPLSLTGSAWPMNLAITCVAFGALLWIVVIQIEKLLGGEGTFGSLGVVLVLVVAVFAMVYYVLATNEPEEFVGLATRTDSLYFAMTTLTTTGFGDIHPQGSVARALVTGQMFFDLVFLATLGTAVSARLSKRGQQQAAKRRASDEVDQ